MTARGEYLKALVQPTGHISVRKLAEQMAQHARFTAMPESIRRSLHRHISGTSKRDVSNRYVEVISEILDLDPNDWPDATPRQSPAALRQRVAELELLLAETRGHAPPAQPAQDEGP